MHGARTITVPWAESGSQWTLLFEAFAVLVMEQVASLNKAAKLLGVSWKEAQTLRKQAVRRGLARRSIDEIEYVGMDEKSFGKKERFITVLTDLTGERVLDVAPSKSSEPARTVLTAIPERAEKFFRHWYFWATHSRIPELIRVAKMIEAHLDNILTYFRHGITNAFTKGMNSKIQENKSAARGLKNFENYRIAILFCCGKLDMRLQQ